MIIQEKYSIHKILKYLYFFIKKNFSSIDWYESYNKQIKINKNLLRKKKIKLLIVRRKSQVNKFKLGEYFNKYNFKLKRFGKKSFFLVLMKNQNFLSSGWIYFGNTWQITEIQKQVKIKRKHLLFDFETPHEIRGKGYYTQLLKLIRNKYRLKRLAIYSVTNNYPSNKAIKRSGFRFIERIHG